MKNIIIFALSMLVCIGVAMAQTYTQGTGITGIDKLGAHQNGGRGCVGCHAPHSGGRGNGGTLTILSTSTPTSNTHNAAGNSYSWSNQTPTVGDSGDEDLWGQDIGPVLGLSLGTGNEGEYVTNLADAATHTRIKTGIVFCLSCHDGNVAKGAMMTNQSFEQAAGLLPASYGSQPIPTLLGADGGAAGNYENDHPIGPSANINTLSIKSYVDFDSASAPTKLILKASQPDTKYTTFQSNYGLPTVVGARAGSGFAVETGMASVNAAYVVCTTCHTPHTMYTASASSTNKIAGLSSGTFPSYFFIAAPYNPGANTANGTKASSATQFCRQCHFTGAGGSNEGSGINTVSTAF
jgi:hypothetical protein